MMSVEVQFPGQFSKDCNRGAKLEIAIDGVKVRLFSIATGYDEGRDVDVGVKNDFQNQRPSKTSFLTSDSVKIPFF